MLRQAVVLCVLALGSAQNTSKSGGGSFCPLGQFEGVGGSCEACGAGMYTDEPGASECKGCPGGKYMDEKGAPECKSCVLVSSTGDFSGGPDEVGSLCLVDAKGVPLPITLSGQTVDTENPLTILQMPAPNYFLGPYFTTPVEGPIQDIKDMLEYDVQGYKFTGSAPNLTAISEDYERLFTTTSDENDPKYGYTTTDSMTVNIKGADCLCLGVDSTLNEDVCELWSEQAGGGFKVYEGYLQKSDPVRFVNPQSLLAVDGTVVSTVQGTRNTDTCELENPKFSKLIAGGGFWFFRARARLSYDIFRMFGGVPAVFGEGHTTWSEYSAVLTEVVAGAKEPVVTLNGALAANTTTPLPGTELLLETVIKANPFPKDSQVKWLKDGQQLTADDKHVELLGWKPAVTADPNDVGESRKYSMRIRKVDGLSKGVYSLQATNYMGTLLTKLAIVPDCSDCSSCVPNSVQFGNTGSCECRQNYFFKESPSKLGFSCAPCPAGSICEGCPSGKVCNTTGDQRRGLCLEPGFWRPSPLSEDLRPCYSKGACAGTAPTNDTNICAFDVCREGHVGPFCELCAEDFSRLPGAACERCTTSVQIGRWLMVGGNCGVLAVMGVLLTWYLLRGLKKAEAEGKAAQAPGAPSNPTLLKRSSTAMEAVDAVQVDKSADELIELSEAPKVDLAAQVKVLVTFSQILSTFPQMFPTVQWPPALVSLASLLGIININVSLFFGFAQCAVAKLSFYDHFIGKMLMLPAAAVPFVLSYLWVCRSYRRRVGSDIPMALRRLVWINVLQMFSILIFLLYPSICATIFATFSCVEIGDKATYPGSYLQADVAVHCWHGTHPTYIAMATFCALFYVAGIPFVLLLTLLRAREQGAIGARRVTDTVQNPDSLWMKLKTQVLRWQGRNEQITHPTTAAETAVIKNQDNTSHVGTGGLRGRVATAWHTKLRHDFTEGILGQFYGSYTDEYYFFECVQLCRKSLLTGVIVLFEEGSGMRITAAFLVCVAYMLIVGNANPMRDRHCDVLEQAAAVVLVLTLFGGLLTKYLDTVATLTEDETGAMRGEYDGLGVAMVIINVIVVSIMLLFIAVGMYENVSVGSEVAKGSITIAKKHLADGPRALDNSIIENPLRKSKAKKAAEVQQEKMDSLAYNDPGITALGGGSLVIMGGSRTNYAI